MGKTIQCMYCGLYSANTNHVCDECEALGKEIEQKQLDRANESGLGYIIATLAFDGYDTKVTRFDEKVRISLTKGDETAAIDVDPRRPTPDEAIGYILENLKNRVDNPKQKEWYCD